MSEIGKYGSSSYGESIVICSLGANHQSPIYMKILAKKCKTSVILSGLLWQDEENDVAIVQKEMLRLKKGVWNKI